MESRVAGEEAVNAMPFKVPRADDNNSRFDMPKLGLGTWQAPKGVVGNAVMEAIRVGYRLVDCASGYGNEQEIGHALHEMIVERKEVRREELFIVSKLFQTDHVYKGDVDRPRQALQRTLQDLQLNQLDLWLMHWPFAFAERTIPEGGLRDALGKPNPKLTIEEEYVETWKSMEQLQREGLVKYIGVSNFRRDQIEHLLQLGLSKPVVNQIELHPYLQQPDLVSFCKGQQIELMAYSPLGSKESYSGSTYPDDIGYTLMENPILQSIAERHGKSVAQILIQWSLQSGFVCIPKSANPTRIRQNFQVNDDCSLKEQDMNQIASLDRNFRYCIGYLPGHYDCPNAPW